MNTNRMPGNMKAILIVDDSQATRNFVGLALKSIGVDVLVAMDGMQALELLPGKEIGLIITDLNMPKIDGLALIRHIRGAHHLKDIPIIVLSSTNDPGLKESCLAAGADAYLLKPFNPHEMQKEVQQIMKKTSRQTAHGRIQT